jgi:acetyl-CoA carboxylase biotin carboxyl carrier protein
MDFKQIQELIKIVNKSNIGELRIEDKEFTITIKQKKEQVIQMMGSQVQQVPMLAPSMPHVSTSAPAGNKKDEKAAVSETDNSHLVAIKSPMIGTFYRRSSPDKPILVEIGDEVTSGTVVCIIEAMKLFNEIESEIKGKIVKVLVEDATPVEYDQPLFLVDPNES